MTPPRTVLFYSPGACSLAAMVVLEWLGQPYELCRVEREVRPTDAYKRINPLGAVPALRVGERVVIENAAILAHLAARRPELALSPPAPGAEWDAFNQWLSILGSGFHVAFYPYFAPQRYSADESHFPALREAAIARVRGQYAFVNRHLEGRRFLLGSAHTALDPYLYAMSRWGRGFLDVPAEFPAIAAHQAEMERDPAVQFCLAVERGDAAAKTTGQCQGHVKLEAIR